MSEKMNIQQKLVEVRKSIHGFNKDTKGFGFDYVSGSQILRAIKGKMDELGVLLIPRVDYDTLHWEKHEYTTKKGEKKLDFIITMKMKYTWVNAEDPEDKIEIDWICIGQQTDDIAKAVGTAMTYNERYFLLKFLGLPTDEDDADFNKEAYYNKNNNKTHTLNIENKWTNKDTNTKILSEAQINRLYKIAYSKGILREVVDEQVFKQMKKKVSELNREEYDIVCRGYENLAIS